MSTTATEPKLEVQTFEFARDTLVAAAPEVVWDAVLAECGPESTMPDGKPFPFTLEAFPGGRWYRDLGSHTGHLWGHVQVIKPPKLLELIGPMMISYPATHHIQYRLAGEGEGTRLTLTHRAFGYFPKDFIKGVDQGWSWKNKRIEEIAMRLKAARTGGRR